MSAGPSASSGAPLHGHRTLRLHVWGASTSLPTLDPTSLYAASLLRSTFADNAQLQLASASTSLSRVPLLQVIDGNSKTVELIDNVEAIRTFCVAAGLDSALASDEELAAKQTALHALVDDHLLDLTLHSLFSLPSNFRTVTAPAYSSVGGTQAPASSLAKLASLPMRFQPSIPSRLRNVVETRLTTVGLWGMGGKEASAKSGEADELAARAGIVPARKKGLGQTAKQTVHDEFERSKLVTKWREVLDVVDAAIGSRVLGASGVGSLDAHVFGYLAPLVFASPSLPTDTLPRLIKTSYPRLQDYLTSTKQHLFPENATPWASPSEVISTPPVLQQASTSTSSSGLLSYIWPFTATSSTDKASFTADSFSATDPDSKPSSTSYRSTAGAGQQRKKSNPSASPEDRKLRLGRALWICSALVGLVGYTFASGIPPTDFAHHDPSTTCAASSSTTPFSLPSSISPSPTCPRKHHIVTGTFNSPNLFVLTYDTLDPSLSILHTIPAEGPHQYLSLGLSSTRQQTVYATTWATPSTLSSWHVSPIDYNLTFGNRKQITATGSYVHVQPPPYSTSTSPGFGSPPGVARYLGSAGGPTGELHALHPETGLIETRLHEIIFLPGGETELKTADKSRKALRYGAHSFDCSSSRRGEQVAFVADLGANAIQAYRFPSLQYLYNVESKRKGDGPRHVIPHPHENVIFTVTEHSNYVDAYQIPSSSSPDAVGEIRHAGEADMLTPHQAHNRGEWRGDTLRFSSNLDYLYATTRGKTAETKGLLIAYRLAITAGEDGRLSVGMTEVDRFVTRTSGGKANAIELSTHPIEEGVDHMVLTDDEEGWVDVVAFDFGSETFKVRASTRLPQLEEGEAQGASHAIWLL
ncbi:LOW QUALITY PROTEIN: hypothetical protein PHBOTO_000552 [Pseudozyma hubeiensis]|nr:LOW QUALITY PROTEIN: hypothetical protein PHBOTO_000552 [Pseudozyma hubeiensis]